MEIIKFEDQTWQDIPDQDNPAMHKQMFDDGFRRPEECIMIFRGEYSRITNGGFVVAHVPLEGDIIKQGVFWSIIKAELFAIALSSYEQFKIL